MSEPLPKTANNSKVTVIAGSVFDQHADLLVIPRATDGSMSEPFRNGLIHLGVSYQKTTSHLGTIEVEPHVSSTNVRQIAYATSVDSNHSDIKAIKSIGEALAGLSRQYNFQTIVSPVLGSGAGKLDPVEAFQALSQSFLATAKSDAILQVVVFETSILHTLTQAREVSLPALTVTVKGMIEHFSKQNSCSAADLVDYILSDHKEYGDGSAPKITKHLHRVSGNAPKSP
jgi:hypothetical protein